MPGGQVTKLTAADGTAGDGFGPSASIFGNAIAVGAGTDDAGGIDARGSVYVFREVTVGLTNNAVWDGSADDPYWTTYPNWQDYQRPDTGTDVAVHFEGSLQTSPTNDYPAESQFGSIFFDDENAFVLGGNTWKIAEKIENRGFALSPYIINVSTTILNGATTTAIIVSETATDTKFETPVRLDGNTKMRVMLTDDGANRTIHFDDVILNGAGSVGSLSATGFGTVVLYATNTYTGPTDVYTSITLRVEGSVTSSSVTRNWPGSTLSGSSGNYGKIDNRGGIDPGGSVGEFGAGDITWFGGHGTRGRSTTSTVLARAGVGVAETTST